MSQVTTCRNCGHPIICKGAYWLHFNLKCPLDETKNFSKACGKKTEVLPDINDAERKIIQVTGESCIYFVEADGKIGCTHDHFGGEQTACMAKGCACKHPEPPFDLEKRKSWNRYRRSRGWMD